MIRRLFTSRILIPPLLFNHQLIFNKVWRLNYNSPADLLAFIRATIKLNMAVSVIPRLFTQKRYLLSNKSENLMIPK